MVLQRLYDCRLNGTFNNDEPLPESDPDSDESDDSESDQSTRSSNSTSGYGGNGANSTDDECKKEAGIKEEPMEQEERAIKREPTDEVKEEPQADVKQERREEQAKIGRDGHFAMVSYEAFVRANRSIANDPNEDSDEV